MRNGNDINTSESTIREFNEGRIEGAESSTRDIGTETRTNRGAITGTESEVGANSERREFGSFSNDNDIESSGKNKRDTIAHGSEAGDVGTEDRHVRSRRSRRERRRKSSNRSSDNYARGTTDAETENELEGFNILDQGIPRKQKSKGQPSKKLNEIEAIANAVQVLFSIPAILLRENHWYLSEEEAYTLAESIQIYLESLPKNKYNKLKKQMEKYLPVTALVFNLAIIIYPRIMQSKIAKGVLQNENKNTENNQNKQQYYQQFRYF